MREALWTPKEALTLERVAHAATKKGLEHMKALLMGRGQGGSLTGDMQNEGLQCADGDGEGSAHASDRRVSTSLGDDKHSFHSSLHTADVASAEDAQKRELFGKAIQPKGEKEMVASPMRQRKMWSPHWSTIQNNHMQTTMVKRGWSNSSIAKRIRRSPQRRHPSAKRISLCVNPTAAPCTGKHRMGNIYASRKRSMKATTNTSKEEEVEEIRSGAL
ncbi:hypothetical protein Cgig2_020205 [Carnegiea gigantea]|uniref:Uncharacterized protein n=1 Tax=Carnegiea gigantea TaxID=171969 RepID=A0A9Q1QPM5_9CARY|nr:hypothetical protein Cgig2_020205 [Carnegiea gigantea]